MNISSAPQPVTPIVATIHHTPLSGSRVLPGMQPNGFAAGVAVPAPPPCLVLPPAPPPSERMPDAAQSLPDGIACLFSDDHGPDACARVRSAMPDILRQFFPWAEPEEDGGGLSFYLADCVLLYALQKAKTDLHEPHRRAFIDEFCAALSVARKITRLLEVGEDVEAVAEHGVRRFLRQGRAVMCPGGANLGYDGHAVMTLLLPQGDGRVLCAVFNRGEGLSPRHLRDADKVRPWLALMPQDALCGAAGLRPLCDLLAQQVPAPDNSVDTYYAALDALVDGCDGIRLVSGAPPVEALRVLGQSLQKGLECTTAGTMAAMHFALALQLRCWQSPPANTPQAARAVYREIKTACRKVILQQGVAERAMAIQRHDTAQVVALSRALTAIGCGMLRRLPHKAGLRGLYDVLPADIRLLAEAAVTSPSAP